MITIELHNAAGDVLAQSNHAEEALLCVNNHIYEKGDAIVITCDNGRHLMVQMGAALLPGKVYVPDGRMTWHIPSGNERRAYAPGAFDGERHIISARVMGADEMAARRNLACNPSDLRGATDFFPHCTANVETRGDAVFAARNVIDGCRHSAGHARWPYQSWGTASREDAWCLLDFGREVTVDEMVLTIRADFPHDSYWSNGRAVLSDGSDIAFALDKTGDRQHISLGRHTVRWIRLERLVKCQEVPGFPALIEWEVMGSDR